MCVALEKQHHGPSRQTCTTPTHATRRRTAAAPPPHRRRISAVRNTPQTRGATVGIPKIVCQENGKRVYPNVIIQIGIPNEFEFQMGIPTNTGPQPVYPNEIQMGTDYDRLLRWRLLRTTRRRGVHKTKLNRLKLNVFDTQFENLHHITTFQS